MNEAQDATVGTPNGGTAARCTGTTKGGERCSKPARRGFTTCASHRTDDETVVEDGDRRGPGRPPSHGLYSQTTVKTLRELREEVTALELDLDDSDQEMVTIKAILLFLFAQSEKLNTKADMLEIAVEAAEATLEAVTVIRDGQPTENELTVAQARQVAAQLVQANKLLAGIAAFTDRLLDANYRTIMAAKIRSDTRARLAEQQAVRQFGELAQRLTQVVWELAPDAQWIDLYEARILRDVLKPVGLELTPEEVMLAKAN